MSDVFVQRSDPVMSWWSPEEERRVAALVETCVREAGGRWVTRVMHSAALTRCWIVEVRPESGGPSRRILLDERRSEPAAELRRALAEMPFAGPRERM